MIARENGSIQEWLRLSGTGKHRLNGEGNQLASLRRKSPPASESSPTPFHRLHDERNKASLFRAGNGATEEARLRSQGWVRRGPTLAPHVISVCGERNQTEYLGL